MFIVLLLSLFGIKERIGCYVDSDDRDLTNRQIEFDVTPNDAIEKCYAVSARYFSLQAQ